VEIAQNVWDQVSLERVEIKKPNLVSFDDVQFELPARRAVPGEQYHAQQRKFFYLIWDGEPPAGKSVYVGYSRFLLLEWLPAGERTRLFLQAGAPSTKSKSKIAPVKLLTPI